MRRLSSRNSGASARALFLCPAPIPIQGSPTARAGFIAVGGWPGRPIVSVRPFPGRACGLPSLNGRIPAPRFSSLVLWPLLTSRPSPNALLRTALPLSRPRAVEISPGNGAVFYRTTAAFTSTAEPAGFAVLCQLAPPCRPRMQFLFIGSWFSPSLPSHGRSPSRSWLQLVFFSLFWHFMVHTQGT